MVSGRLAAFQVVGGGQVPSAGVVALGNVKDTLPLLGIVDVEGRAVAVIVGLAQLHTAQRIKALCLQ